MTLYETLKARRSVKQYDPEHRFTDDEIRTLISAAHLAPTSFNIQNRHFVVVVDPQVKERLKAAAWGQAQVGDASAVFVICADLKSHERPERYLRDVPSEAREKLEPMIAQLYGGNEALLRDEACRSVGLASMALMLMATEMGYDCCPMIGFDPPEVSEAVGLDADHPPLLIVAVGKGTQPARPRAGLLNLEEVASIDRLGGCGPEGPIDA